MGKAMPPAWSGARVSVPVLTPDLGCVGRVLPGKGLYLDHDLKYFGIEKPVPNVFQRTMVMRLMDFFHQNDRAAISVASALTAAMCFPKLIPLLFPVFGAITTYDGIIAARGGGKANDVAIGKASFTTVANVWSSMFQASGIPTVGTYTAIPGGAAQSRASTGAWSVGLSNPVNPAKKYLLTFGFTSSVAINFAMLVDLLVAAGNIDTNSALQQTINSTALTRYTTGAGVMMTFDITVALSTTPANLTVDGYHNQAGTAGRTTPAVAMTTSGIILRLQPAALGPFMELQAGDYGVQSVETLTFSAAMGGTGKVALNLYFPLGFIPGLSAGVWVERDSTIQIDGIAELVQTAGGVIGCLNAYIQPNSTTSGVMNWSFRTCEG